jgi:hypothetical protein
MAKLLLAAALLTLSGTARADDFVDVYDDGARAAAKALKRGSILISYCEPCSQHYDVKYLFDFRVVASGDCLSQLEARTVTLFTGQAKAADRLGLTAEACQASGESTDAAIGFSYSFRPTKDPLRFVSLGTDTMLAAQFSGTLKLTAEDRDAIDTCAASLRKRAEKLGRSTLERSPPDPTGGPIAEVRKRYDEVSSGAAQACPLRTATAELLARSLKSGLTVLDPYGGKRASKRVTVQPAGADKARVLVDGAPFDADTMLFLRKDGRAVFAAALFETDGCTSPSAGSVCVDARALVDAPAPPLPCNIGVESDCQ